MTIEETSQWRMVRILEEISSKLDRLLFLADFYMSEGIQRRIQEAIGSSRLRREIFELCDGTRTVGEVAAILRRKQPSISEQLAILVNRGVVRVKRRGKFSYYEKIA
jgi:DNA-binding transcriptional ArsR family regulator